VAPRGVHGADVVAGPAPVLAVRAHEPATAQRDGDGDPRRLERDLAHGGTRKGQKAVECGSDAHGQLISGLGLGHRQPYGLARARRASRSRRLVRAATSAFRPIDPKRTHIHFRSPGFEWWACEDLNLGPLPYQQNAGNRCADGPFRRSRATVGAKVKWSIGVQLCVLPDVSRSAPSAEDCTPRSVPSSTCMSAKATPAFPAGTACSLTRSRPTFYVSICGARGSHRRIRPGRCAAAGPAWVSAHP